MTQNLEARSNAVSCDRLLEASFGLHYRAERRSQIFKLVDLRGPWPPASMKFRAGFNGVLTGQ